MGIHKRYTGIVLSDKMQKTRVVKIIRLSKHPKYGRIIKNASKFKVHDEKNASKIGDTVRIEETRPLSKDKRFRVVDIIKKANLSELSFSEEAK